MPTAEPSGVKVLHKTFDVLEAIKRTPEGAVLAEISRQVELPKPTVHRILGTLEARGYVGRRDDGRYVLGQKLFATLNETSIDQVLSRVSLPILERLVASCRETVNLGILDGGEIVVINTVESPQAVRMASKIGNRRWVHSTALGKVLLAGMPDKEVQHLLKMKGTPALTPHTLTTRTAVLEDIHRVRAQGYAVDNQENEMEGRCVAAAITDGKHRTVAALSISGPVFRMDMEHLCSLVPDLKQACDALSKAAGA